MINQFIRKLPFVDQSIFWLGKFFSKIGNWFLGYKDFKYWQPHFNKLVLKNVKVFSDGEYLQYHFEGLTIFTRIFSSDSPVLDMVILQEEYKAATDIFLLNNISLNSFLDLGSNIGLTTLYVKKIFPNCEVLALEPDEQNFSMINRNVKANDLNNTRVIKGGVGKKDCYLQDDGGIRNKKEWAHSYTEVDSPTNIVSYSMSSLMKKFPNEEVDFLKIDVEGAEKEIFSDDADIGFLSNVKVIALEIHDEFDVRNKIYEILKNNNFVILNSGETTLAFKKNLFQ